jgi:alkylated DNA nucleotide flippase Atl1
MAGRKLGGRGMGSTVAHATLDVVGTRLSHASGSDIFITLVDGVLHLLQELVDVDQVVFGTNVRHGWEMVGRSRATARAITTATTTNSDVSWHGLIFRNGSVVQNGQLKCLETKQALAHGGVRVGVKLASLEITEEFIQGIISTLAIVRLLAIMALAQSIVHVPV